MVDNVTIATAAEPGLRQRKKRALRAALQRAALDLAERHGVSEVTVEAITAAANVSPRTFFNYFSGKEQAIAGVDPDQPAAASALLTARPDGEPPLVALRETVVALVSERTDDLGMLARRQALARANPTVLAAQIAGWALTEQALVTALAARMGVSAARDDRPALAVATMAAAARVAVSRSRPTVRPHQLADAVRANCDRVMRGLDPL